MTLKDILIEFNKEIWNDYVITYKEDFSIINLTRIDPKHDWRCKQDSLTISSFSSDQSKSDFSE